MTKSKVMIFGFCLAAAVGWIGCATAPAPSSVESAQQAVDKLRVQVRSSVHDTNRAAQVIGCLNQLESLMLEARADRQAHENELRKLNANYDATVDEFAAAFASFNAKKSQRQSRVLDIHQRLRSQLDDAEWKDLVQTKSGALEAAINVGRGR